MQLLIKKCRKYMILYNKKWNQYLYITFNFYGNFKKAFLKYIILIFDIDFMNLSLEF